jgi:hypothetical protein
MARFKLIIQQWDLRISSFGKRTKAQLIGKSEKQCNREIDEKRKR